MTNSTYTYTYYGKRYLVATNREGFCVWYDPAKETYYIGPCPFQHQLGGGQVLVHHYSKNHSDIMKLWERSYA